MRTTLFSLVVGTATLVGGCATSHHQPMARSQSAQTAIARRTVELEAASQAKQIELTQESMAQWQREGWSVLSVSAPVTQPDGKLKWQAQLERKAASPGAGNGYDDRLIAQIRRGQTTSEELVAWFGPPESREVNPDGRGRLSWQFRRNTANPPGNSGLLDVKLSPDGKVESYSARRTPKP